MPFGTEGGLYQGDCGIPSVVCGPGDIRHAHCPDEFVAVDQILACEHFVDRLLRGLDELDADVGDRGLRREHAQID